MRLHTCIKVTPPGCDVCRGNCTILFDRQIATNIAVSLDFEPLSGRLL